MEDHKRGFSIGFNNSANKEIAKKDGYLSLYLKFEMDSDKPDQRDSVIPDFKLLSSDNKGDKLDLIYDSNEDKYINLSKPYSVVMFKTYYDAQTFNITIHDTTYVIKSEIIK